MGKRKENMQRIIVTGATSMIGTALIKECIKKGIEVYAVVRAFSGKKMRLPQSEKLDRKSTRLNSSHPK